MSNNTLWVALFTGGTAVLASWVTTLGNARSARVQAEASAHAQRHSHVREMRRAAYLDLMEQAHITGQLYWKVGDAFLRLPDEQDQLACVQGLRVELRAAFDPLMRCTGIVGLEGPRLVAAAAEALREAAREANGPLARVSRSEPGARERFDDAETGCPVATANGACSGPAR